MNTPTHIPQAHAGMKLNTELIDFALRIRGWSRNDLARKTGYSTGHISRTMAGTDGASAAFVKKIRAAFDNRIEWDEVVVVEDDTPTDRGDE